MMHGDMIVSLLTWHVSVLVGHVHLGQDGDEHIDALTLVVQYHLHQNICNTQGYI